MTLRTDRDASMDSVANPRLPCGGLVGYALPFDGAALFGEPAIQRERRRHELRRHPTEPEIDVEDLIDVISSLSDIRRSARIMARVNRGITSKASAQAPQDGSCQLVVGTKRSSFRRRHLAVAADSF